MSSKAGYQIVVTEVPNSEGMLDSELLLKESKEKTVLA